MAVFTEVSEDAAQTLLQRLSLGQLTGLRGIEGGIENTNYFLSTDKGEWVLTLFERLSAEQLPFYLYLMKHLAHKGIPVPDPQADRESGDILHQVCGKPAAIVQKLAGKSQLAPAAVHCEAVGAMLARMHLAGRDYERSQPNLRGLPWWNETVPVVLPYLQEAQSALLRAELAYQNHVAASSSYAALPRGPVHADLFRDNVMFDGERLTGFFDFYFAGVDTFLFDLAVCLNDWCVDLPTGRHDAPRPGHACGLPGGAPAHRCRAHVAACHGTCGCAALLDLTPVGFPPAARGQHAEAPRPRALRARAARAHCPPPAHGRIDSRP